MADVVFSVDSASLAPVQQAVIRANFEDCREALTEMLAPYAGLVVAEDGIAAAKADRARINRVAANIDEARKMVKRVYTEPLAEFEAKCKELTGICNSAANNLDGQIKGFEQRKKDERFGRLESYYVDHIGEYGAYLPWTAVMNTRWGNTSYSEDKAREEIDSAIKGCADDLAAIRDMGGGFQAAVLDYYRQTRDIGACIRKHNELVRLEAEEKARREAHEKARQPKEPDTAPPPEPRDAEMPEAPAEPETTSVAFTAYGTRRQLIALAGYMRENGIRFERSGF